MENSRLPFGLLTSTFYVADEVPRIDLTLAIRRNVVLKSREKDLHSSVFT